MVPRWYPDVNVCVRARACASDCACVCGGNAHVSARVAQLCANGWGNIVVPLAAYTHSHPGLTCCSAWYTSWQYHMRAGCFTRYMVATCAPSASAKLSARRSQARCAAPVSCGVADKSALDSRISWAKLSGAASGMGQIFVWGTNACGELGGGFDPRVLPLLSHSSLPQPQPQPQPGGTDPMHHGYGRSQRVCNEPVPVDRLPGDATFVNIACGATHSVAISSAPQLIYHACNRHATERTGIAAL